jgi:hypothetical protein
MQSSEIKSFKLVKEFTYLYRGRNYVLQHTHSSYYIQNKLHETWHTCKRMVIILKVIYITNITTCDSLMGIRNVD